MKKKSHTYIEIGFVLFLLLIIISTIVYGYISHKPKAQAVTKIQTTELANNSEAFLLYYNQFWQKFGTTAAVTADLNHDSIVSQTEINLYKDKFIMDMGLKIDPDNETFVINEFNSVVSPEKLTCYLNHYTPRRSSDQRAEILKAC